MAQIIDQNGNPVFFSGLGMMEPRNVTLPQRKFCVIVAVDLEGGFSKAGEIPWYYTEDFKWFKNRTQDSICVMGRVTYESICKKLGDKATESVLPNRKCFVVSSTMQPVGNATVIRSISDLKSHLDPENTTDVCFIGGESVYTEAIAVADIVYVTVVNKEYECDLFFPTKYLLKHFEVSQMYKGEEADVRYVVFRRKG